MSEKSVQEWIDEAGTEPTPFGRAVIEIGRDQGFPLLVEDASVLELEERDELALIDHMDGVDTRDDDSTAFVRNVAAALGLDHSDPADKEPCTKLAYTHLYREPYQI